MAGYETVQQVLQRRRQERQQSLFDAYKQNMSAAQNMREYDTMGMANLFGAIGTKLWDKYIAKEATPQNDEELAAAQKIKQLQDSMSGGAFVEKRQETTPEGGIVDTSRPMSKSEILFKQADIYNRIGSLSGDQKAIADSVKLRMQAFEVQKAEAAAQAQAAQKEAFIQSIPPRHSDLVQLAKDSETKQIDIQKIIEDRDKAGDNYKVLTNDEAIMRGLNPQANWQINTKTNKIDRLDKEAGVKITNNLGGSQLSVLQEEVDKKYAPILLEWNGGKGADTIAQISALQPVLKDLEEGKPLTGLPQGILPDFALAITNPESLDARNIIESVLQRNLKSVLGAQFTQVEGEALIKRGYNPMLSPEVNAKRVGRLVKQMSIAAEQQQAMADYASINGTLAGYKGRVPTISDFDKVLDEEDSSSTTSGYSEDALSILDEARSGGNK